MLVSGRDKFTIRSSQIFENTIYSKGLKLSVAVHSSSAEILICRLCVYHFRRYIPTANFM